MILQALMLAISEGAEEKAPPVIDIDGTVLVQFAIFIAMFIVLRQFLFKPYVQMRDDRAHGAGIPALEHPSGTGMHMDDGPVRKAGQLRVCPVLRFMWNSEGERRWLR